MPARPVADETLQLIAAVRDALAKHLGACRAWGVESENRPQREQFSPDLQRNSRAIGQKDGEKWAAAVDLQPTIPKSDRLLCADAVVDERTLFGCHAFMVDDKLCIAVKHEDLLVRLPPAEHEATAETPGLRELDPRGGMRGYFWVEPDAYATRAQWQRWIAGAVAFNPQAKASPRRRKAPAASGLEARRKSHGP